LSVKIADALNSRLDRLLPLIAPAGVILGFLLPGIFIQLRPLVPYLFGMMTLSGALKLRTAEFGKTLRSPIPILVFFIFTRIVMPLIGLAVTTLFFKDKPDIATGFILLLSGPIAVSSFIWVTIYNGDKALCLTLIMLDTILAPFIMPGTISLLMGTKVTIDIFGIALSLILMVVLPTIIGVTINETSRGKIPAIICPYLNPLSKICLILVIAANSSPVSKMIKFNDKLVWLIAGVCILLIVIVFLLSRLSSLIIKCNREKSASLLFCGGMRNISSVTTIAVTFFPETAVLPALLGILCQQSVCAIMAKLLLPKKQEKLE